LSFASPDDVETAVTQVLTVMTDGGGYIAAPSHTITIPEANRQAMFRAMDKFNGQKRPMRG
jgi:urease alpha subunit